MYIYRRAYIHTIVALNKANPTFSKGASCSCPPEARDPSWIAVEKKDSKAVRYMETPNRVFCRPYLFLSR